jgi:hypothetical protein
LASDLMAAVRAAAAILAWASLARDIDQREAVRDHRDGGLSPRRRYQLGHPNRQGRPALPHATPARHPPPHRAGPPDHSTSRPRVAPRARPGPRPSSLPRPSASCVSWNAGWRHSRQPQPLAPDAPPAMIRLPNLQRQVCLVVPGQPAEALAHVAIEHVERRTVRRRDSGAHRGEHRRSPCPTSGRRLHS